MNLNLAKQVGAKAVKDAGKALMKNFKRLDKAKYKQRNDIVTENDFKSEAIIKKYIRKNFPNHNILSEESGAELHDAEYSWIVDPIDGTINYFHGSPPFRVGVCLLKKSQAIMTFIYNPHGDYMHFAQKGKGAYKNNKRLHVSTNTDLQKTIVQTHVSSRIEARARTLMALGSIFRNVLHIRAVGCGLASATYVADGKFDVFFNISTNPWDILPGSLLINEAGGKATDIEGRAITAESTSILATNGKLHSKMLNMLKNV